MDRRATEDERPEICIFVLAVVIMLAGLGIIGILTGPEGPYHPEPTMTESTH